MDERSLSADESERWKKFENKNKSAEAIEWNAKRQWTHPFIVTIQESGRVQI